MTATEKSVVDDWPPGVAEHRLRQNQYSWSHAMQLDLLGPEQVAPKDHVLELAEIAPKDHVLESSESAPKGHMLESSEMAPKDHE